MAERFEVCRTEELPPGARKIIDAGGKSIGVFNVHGELHAIRNVCPHQYAPLCEGIVTGTTLPSDVGQYLWARDGEIIRCPWHGWEFDILTGRSIFNPHKCRVKTYEVSVEPEEDEALEKFPVEIEGGLVVLHA